MGQITEGFANLVKGFEFYPMYEGKPLKDCKQMSEMF